MHNTILNCIIGILLRIMFKLKNQGYFGRPETHYYNYYSVMSESVFIWKQREYKSFNSFSVWFYLA